MINDKLNVEKVLTTISTDYAEKLAALDSDHRAAMAAVGAEDIALDAAEQELAHSIEARQILQDAAQAVQQAAHMRIAGVVTRCLSATFGDDAYEFQILFEQKRGKTEARLVFVRDGLELSPLDAAGGGVIDVAAFALRLACLMLRRPPARRLLVLDEPFKHLSRNHRPGMRELLLELAVELEMQFIIVTHDPALSMGSVLEL